MRIIEVDHIHITVPEPALESARRFYGSVLRLEEIPRHASASSRAGAWYKLGRVEIHLSVEGAAESNLESKRHICYLVDDLDMAEREFREAGIEVFPDERPIEGRKRFYVRDPGGNRLEIVQPAL